MLRVRAYLLFCAVKDSLLQDCCRDVQQLWILFGNEPETDPLPGCQAGPLVQATPRWFKQPFSVCSKVRNPQSSNWLFCPAPTHRPASGS